METYARVLSLKIKNSDHVDYDWFNDTYQGSKVTLTDLLEEGYMGDTGFDLHCPKSCDVPANSIGFKIKLGIHISASIINYSNEKPVTSNPSSVDLYPRSSTGSKTPLRLANSIGLIDRQYRGELIAIVDNISDTDYHIQKGDRLFQLVAPSHIPICPVILSENLSLDTTDRGSGGLGSTGR